MICAGNVLHKGDHIPWPRLLNVNVNLVLDPKMLQRTRKSEFLIQMSRPYSYMHVKQRTTKKILHKIQTFINSCLRRIYRIRWEDRVRNEVL